MSFRTIGPDQPRAECHPTPRNQLVRPTLAVTGRSEQREPRSGALRGSPSRATLPPTRISLGVHAGDDDDGLAVDTIEETVGKAQGNERAPSKTMQDGVSFWVFENAIPRRVERQQELLAQARPPRFVPSIGILDICSSCGPDDNPLH